MIIPQLTGVRIFPLHANNFPSIHETLDFINGILLSPNLKTLTHYFGEAGYATGYIGKWHLYSRSGAGPGPVPAEHRGGYDYWLASNVLEFTSDAYQTTTASLSGCV